MYQELHDEVERMIKFCIETEEKTPLSQVTNFEEVSFIYKIFEDESNVHGDTFAWRIIFALGSLLFEDTFAERLNFARVTILHESGKN